MIFALTLSKRKALGEVGSSQLVTGIIGIIKLIKFKYAY
jgi:hypothetical protein